MSEWATSEYKLESRRSSGAKRRTVRTGLSRLKVTEEAREAVMAHARPGIKGTYDLYDYLDEKRDALDRWAAKLRSIIEPPPPNVVELRAGAGSGLP